MSKTVKRGYSPNDENEFKGADLETLRRSAADLYYLLNRGYSVKTAATFIGNHYLLSERQRIALIRYTSSSSDLAIRKEKRKQPESMNGETVNIDGFNEIITLEVAQSGSPVFKCMDGTYRDLAGLHGTYRLIDKTDLAIKLIITELQKFSAKEAIFWLDAPVSNSGRLKTKIAEISEEKNFEVGIEIVRNVDRMLYDMENVISSDSIVLDRCTSWINLKDNIIQEIPDSWLIDLKIEEEDAK